MNILQYHRKEPDFPPCELLVNGLASGAVF